MDEIDGEKGLQGSINSNKFIVIENGTKYFKITQAPFQGNRTIVPSVNGSFVQPAKIRGISMRLISPSSASTATLTETNQSSLVKIVLFTKKPNETQFVAVTADTQEAQVSTMHQHTGILHARNLN